MIQQRVKKMVSPRMKMGNDWSRTVYPPARCVARRLPFGKEELSDSPRIRAEPKRE